MIQMMRPGQLAADIGGAIHRDFVRWLTQLVSTISLGIVPARGILSAKLSGAEVLANFDATGLGNRNGPYDGWAICNGSNGTDDWSGQPMAPYIQKVSEG
jgi:hypothetical protein